jgi:hypothetical protein
MRSWLCLALVGCGIDTQPASAPVPPIAAARPAVPRPPAPPPLTAAHGSEIVALAVTDDGGAVASADRLGGLRLWPALDGTREPVVIRGTAARAMTLARDDDGFALTALDEAGGVHMMRISGAGAVRERITLAGDQRALEIDGTPAGVIVLRADQTLELVDRAGHIRARLTPDPGTRVDTVLARGTKALALVREGKRVHGRWIDLDRGMRWGSSTPSFAIKLSHAVLSPDGGVLAVSRPRSLHPLFIDLATGAALKTPACVPRDWPGDDGETAAELLRTDNTPLPLGFLSETVVACSVTSSLQWWNTDGTPRPNVAGAAMVGAFPVAIADRVLVVGMGAQLALATPTTTRYLGYGVREVVQLKGAERGVLVASGDQGLLLDARLRERSRFDLARTQVDWREAVVLDDRHALTVAARRGHGRDEGFQLAVVDGLTRTQRQLVPYQVADKDLRFEPATGILATADAAGTLLLRLDREAHTFGAAMRIPSWLPPMRVVPIDPALSGGIAVLEIDDGGDGAIVGEFPLADLRPSQALAPRRTYRVPGAFRGNDRAGRLYMKAADAEEIVVYAGGDATARLPALAGMTLRPSPDGALIAAIGAPRLVLLTAGGQVRWETALWNEADVVWTSDGELVAAGHSGVATVDLATGALVERRCGWAFGLSDVPFDAGRDGPTICEVAR